MSSYYPEINYSSQEWSRVEEWLKDELEEVYKRIANLTTTETETQQLRGRASLLQQMLSFREYGAAIEPPNY